MNASAVITNPETEEKYGWTAQAFRPSVSFLCPENTYTVPAYQTACGSADILSHIMEVYFQKEETFPATEAYMEAMMRSVMKDAPIAMADPANEDARANLLWTASWAINDFIDSGHSVSWTCHASSTNSPPTTTSPTASASPSSPPPSLPTSWTKPPPPASPASP